MKYTENSPENSIRLMCIMALVDDELHEDEVAMINKMGIEYGLEINKIKTILEETKNLNSLEEVINDSLELITDKSTQQKTLSDVMKICTADYLVKEKEYLFLQIAIDKWQIF
ncbi:hypothetical protein N9R19_01265 [Pelagibacterales bacterium]|nr:hypothetical protein [Pelagibacterales bacterium]